MKLFFSPKAAGDIQEVPLLEIEEGQVTRSALEHLPPATPEAACLCGRRFADITLKFSPIAAYVSILALNILFILGKESLGGISERTTVLFYTCLVAARLLSVPYDTHEAVKISKDLKLAREVQDPRLIAISSLRLAKPVSSLALASLNMAAALAQQFGSPETMRQIFRITVPWGVADVVIFHIVSVLITMQMNMVTWQRMRSHDFTAPQIRRIFVLVAPRHDGRESQAVDTLPTLKPERVESRCQSVTRLENLDHFAARIRAGMDKDTLRKLHMLIEKLEDEHPSSLNDALAVVQKNVSTQAWVVGFCKLVGITAGTPLMLVKRRNPNTVTEAVIDAVTAAGMALYLTVSKYLEASQRNELESLSAS